MFAVGTQAHSVSTRKVVRGLGIEVEKSDWMQTGEDRSLSPTVFLVEQPANCIAGAHFHRQNQFQVFVDGSGSVGRNTVEAVTVHYAGAYTGYGPLSAGARGLKYFTIRPVFDTGSFPVVQARDKMLPGPKRHAVSDRIKSLSPDQLAMLPAPVAFDAIPVGEDGMGARWVQAPPEAAVYTDFPLTADGTFMLVLAGTANYDGGALQRWESAFASTQSELPLFVAGPNGAEVIFLFTPAKSPAYP
jgi:hypothetical protein